MTIDEQAQQAAVELNAWFPMVQFNSVLPFGNKRIIKSKFLSCCALFNEELPRTGEESWDIPRMLDQIIFKDCAGLTEQDYTSLKDKIVSAYKSGSRLDVLVETASLFGNRLSTELKKICLHDDKLPVKISESFKLWRKENETIGLKRENGNWTFFVDKKENPAANWRVRHTSPNVFINLRYIACKSVRLTQIGACVNEALRTGEVDGSPISEFKNRLKLKRPSPENLFRRYLLQEGSRLDQWFLKPFCNDGQSASELKKTNISSIGVYVVLFLKFTPGFRPETDYDSGWALLDFLQGSACAGEDADEADIDSYCLDLALETHRRESGEDMYGSMFFSTMPIPDKYVSGPDGDRFLQCLTCAARERKMRHERIKNALSNRDTTFMKNDDQNFRNVRKLLLEKIKNSSQKDEKSMRELQEFLENSQWTRKVDVVRETLNAFKLNPAMLAYLQLTDKEKERIIRIFEKTLFLLTPAVCKKDDADETDEGDEDEN